ncbi:MAG: DUF507 family protein [Deltaproteobacteria bacterium]|nr:DUF507 family protein [Deltaproteobacteria bacterium]
MKLTKEQVEKIMRTVIEKLKEKELVEMKSSEAKILERMTEAFLADLRAEDSLDREVEEILKGHSGEIDSQRLDYRKMFNIVKGKLARERGIIL